MKKIITLCFLMALVGVKGWGQVSLTATAGTATGTYTTVNGAFAAINAGTHQGAIVISISANTTETAPAVLNSTGAGSANYTSVLIQPSADGVIVTTNYSTAGRGVIELNGADNVTINGDNPNTTGTNKNLTITCAAVNTTTYTSAIRIAAGTAAPYLDNNNISIKNLVLNGSATSQNSSAIVSTTGAGNTTFGVVVGPGGASTVTALGSISTSINASATVNSFIVDNCTINQCSKGIGFLGSSATSSTGITITNNLIGDQSTTLSGIPPFTTPVTTVYTKGIYIQGTTSLTITSNTIKNIVGFIGTTSNGIELASAIGATGGTLLINKNTISGIVNNATTSANGILVSSAIIGLGLSGNTISNVQGTYSGAISGLNISSSATVTPSVTIEQNKISTIYNRSTNGWSSRAINIVSGSNQVIQNNFIWDVNTYQNNSNSNTSYGARGIYIGASNGHKIYHNSVSLSGAMLGTSAADVSSCLTILTTSLTGIDVRNNIFSNTMTGLSGSGMYCIQLPASGTSSMALTLNNNAYYSTTNANSFIGATTTPTQYTAANFNAASTSPSANLRSYTSTLSSAGTNDNASYASTNAAPFISATDLHLNPSSTEITKVESKGANLSVATDIDNDPRGTTPDMGADEITIISGANDAGITGLATPITCPGSQNVTVGLKNYGTAPLTSVTIAWSINGVAQTPYAWTGNLAAGASTNVTLGTYNFVFNTSYTIVASTSSPNGTTDANTNNDAYPGTAFKTGVTGTVTVGASGANYTTLTAAFSDINNYGLCGPTVISILNNYNSASETFPLTLNTSTTSVNTLTIKPASGATPTISGTSTTGLIVLNGADYVTIDGSNSGGTDKSLTITNTNITTYGSSTILITSLGTGLGAVNNTIRNCNISAVATTSYYNFGIAVSGADNDNITIQNNTVSVANYPIYALGTAAVSAGGLDNLLITNNIVTSTNTTNTSYTNIGIRASNAVGSTISLNTISVISGYTFSSPVGISLEAGYVSSNVYKNTIAGVTLLSTSTGYAGKGIIVFTGSSASALNIYNNFIYGVNGAQSSAGVAYAPMGIGIGVTGTGVGNATGGVNIYYNSISLTGTYASTVAAKTSALFIGASASTLDLRDNIFYNILSNTGTGAAKNYAIYSNVASSGSTTFTNIDYNDYYVSGSQGVLGYINGSDNPGLADIQTNFGSNINSKNVDPAFTSATNLHIPANTSSQLESGGIAAGGITDDIDGETRAPGLTANGGGTAPDIGADEFDGVKPASCTTPAAQPTALLFTTVTSTTVSGSFTAASPAPSGYIIFRSTSALAPAPIDGTTYNTGGSYSFNSAPYFVVSNGNSVTFTDAPPSANTVYYYYVFSVNNGTCVGGPKYLTTAPLSSSAFTCTVAATTLTGTATSTTTATITYSGVAGATSTVLEYKPSSGTTWTIASPAPATITTGNGTYNLTGLTAATTYDLRITEPNASCGTPKVSTSAFTTFCDPVGLPYTQNFDGVTAPTIPACTLVQDVNGDGTRWVTSSSSPSSSPNSLYYSYNSSNAADDWWFTPGLNLTVGAAYRVTFKYKIASSSFPENLEVKTGTSQSAASMSSTALWSVTNDNTSTTYQTITVNFTATSAVQYFGWHIFSAADKDGIYLDDISIIAAPTCDVPTGLTASNVTTTSATVSWAAPALGTPAGYNWEVRSSGAGGSGSTGLAASGSTTSPVTSASATGLAPSSTYNLYVQTNCGGSTSTWAGPYTFGTVCANITTFPWAENFDGLTTVGAGVLPNCWTTTTGSSAFTTKSTSDGYHSAYSTPNYVDIYYGSTASYLWAPNFTLTAGTTYNFSFYWAGDGTSGWNGSAYVNTTASATGATNLGTFVSGSTTTTTSYTQATFSFTPSVTGTYYFGVSANTSSFSPYYLGFDNFSVAIAPSCTGSNGGTASAASSTICGGSGSTTLSATGYSTGNTSVYQWQYSSDGTNFSDLSGQVNPLSASTGTITTTTSYRLKVTCTAVSTTGYSNIVTVTVNNPLVASTSPGARCGTGSVTLGATASSGATINWYAASSGGAVLATGNSYTTPLITSTTTFYASAVTGGGSEAGGKLSSAGADGSFITTTWGVVFDANKSFTLNSTVIYPTGTGTITLALLNSSGTELASTAPISVTGSGISTPVTVPLGFTVPVGVSYRLIVKAYTGITNLIRDNGIALTYPYASPSGAISVTGSWFGSVTTSAYYFFYNLNISSGCESGRTPVVATINPLPTVSLTNNATSTTCINTAITYTTDAGQTSYVWTIPGTPGTDYTLQAGTGTSTSNTAVVTWKTAGSKTVSVNYTNSNGCTAASATSSTLTVTGSEAVTLDAGSGSASQNICQGSPITKISYSVSGSATGVSISNLPSGLSSTTSNLGKTIEITGTPTAAGTYTVSATGGCGTSNLQGTIAFKPLSTASFTQPSGYTTCQNQNIALPVSGTPSARVYFTINGSATQYYTDLDGSGNGSVTTNNLAVGTNTYTLVAADATSTNCAATLSSTTTVTASAIPAITLATGSANPSVCKTNSFTTTFTLSGSASGATVSGLPSGVSYSVSGSTVTITGTPTASGNYTITSTGNGSCSAASLSGSISIQSYLTWTGATDNNWNTGGNWCSGTKPAATDDVVIPSGLTNYPILPTNITVNSVTLNTGATVNNNGFTLTAGTVSGAGTITGSATSSLVTSQSSTVYFTNGFNLLKNLTVNGTGTLTLGNALNIVGGANYGIVSVANGATLVSNGLLTLRSDSLGTAAIAANTSGTNYITGTVTAEQFIPISNVSPTRTGRAWRLITAPVSSTTIGAAWQENMLYDGSAYHKISDGSLTTAPAGYGTMITGYGQGTATNANSHGYDYWSIVANTNSSIRYFVPGATATSGSWQSLTTIVNKDISSEAAYMLFVRGDRKDTTQAEHTTLRATGTVNQVKKDFTIDAAKAYNLMGNPFPSTIDWSLVYSHASAYVQDKFLTWNSKIGTFGAYVLVQNEGGNNYSATPQILGGTKLTDPTVRFISGGAGFLVYPKVGGTGTATVSVIESDKNAAQVPPANPFRIVATDKKLYVNLNFRDSDTTATLADGFLARFDNSYDTAINEDDATKQSNFNENLGILSHNTDLIVEARADVQKRDTLHMKLWNVTKRDYQLQLKGDNWASAPGVQAYLVDNYLASKQAVSLTGSVSTVNFTVNTDSASWKSDRFSIVFQNDAAVLPVTLTSVKAAAQNGGVNVTWTVRGEQNIKGYTVERSVDGGGSYTAIGSQQAAKNAAGAAAITNYQSFDAAPQAGDNFYRIRVETQQGVVTYSGVVKVTIGEGSGKILITLYPNPVRPNGRVSLQLTNLPAGSYRVSVYSGAGQTVYQQKITIGQANTTQSETLHLGSTLAQGSYEVRLSSHTGTILFTDQLVIGR